MEIIASLLMFLTMTNAYAYTWKPIAPGIDYAHTENVHAFKIDPKLFQFSLFTARDIKETDSTAAMLAKKSGAILAINGGFFSPSHKSLGLLMREGETLNPIHPTKWWGIFSISKTKAAIQTPQNFTPEPSIEMAVQAGPRLVIDGEIPKLKDSVDYRSGIGIRADGNIVIAVTDETEKSMESFAKLFQRPENKEGFNCKDALNLDGGGSSQLHFDMNHFKIEVQGLSRITNTITVFAR